MIRIATWNIGCGVNTELNIEDNFNKLDNINTINNITEIINAENIEIIGIQETITNFKAQSYSEYIKNHTNLKYYYQYELSDSHLINEAKMGISIHSKFPILHHKCIPFFNPNIEKISKTGKVLKSHDKGMLFTKINTKEGELIFITAHAIPSRLFNTTLEEHLKYIQPLVDRINSTVIEGKKVIFAGDLNIENAINILPDNITSLINMPTTVYELEQDYILSSKNITCLSAQTIRNEFDHYLCMAEISLI